MTKYEAEKKAEECLITAEHIRRQDTNDMMAVYWATRAAAYASLAVALGQ